MFTIGSAKTVRTDRPLLPTSWSMRRSATTRTSGARCSLHGKSLRTKDRPEERSLAAKKGGSGGIGEPDRDGRKRRSTSTSICRTGTANDFAEQTVWISPAVAVPTSRLVGRPAVAGAGGGAPARGSGRESLELHSYLCLVSCASVGCRPKTVWSYCSSCIRCVEKLRIINRKTRKHFAHSAGPVEF